MISHLRHLAIFVFFFMILVLGSSQGEAGVAVLANRTDTPVHFSIVNSDGKPQKYTLDRTDVMPIPVSDKVGIAYESEGKPQKYFIYANTIYFFATADKALELRTFSLPAPPNEDPNFPQPKPRDIAHAKYTVTVKILADDDQPAIQKIWEKELRERIAAASDIFEHHCGVRFEVKAVDTWISDNSITDFQKSLMEFEMKVNPAPADLAIGFTSQYAIPHGETHLGGTRGPLRPYILIREWSQHVTKSERLEILVHEMGHYLGASHTADPESVMRPELGDRRSHSTNFRIGFDPLNTLAMNIVSDELRAHTFRHFSLMPLDTRRELQRIYMVLGKEVPKDPAAAQFIEVLNLPMLSAVSAPPPKPSELVVATQAVVKAVVNAAKGNSRASIELKGDGLTEYLIRRAASEAANQPEPVAAKSFLLGIGIALDDSKLWHDFPWFGNLCKEVESDYERQERLSVLGKTTIYGRHDLAQHFVVSCALAAQIGPAGAEQAGIAKEIRDSQGESGFSFIDLLADMAGVTFASHVQDGKISLNKLADSFNVRDFVPDIKDLKEGIAADDFADDYGSINDDRCRKVRIEILNRIKSLHVYKKP
jgi:hypothetical protein